MLALSFSGRGSWHGAIKEETHKVLEVGTDGSRRQRRLWPSPVKRTRSMRARAPRWTRPQGSPRPTSGRGAPVLGL